MIPKVEISSEVGDFTLKGGRVFYRGNEIGHFYTSTVKNYDKKQLADAFEVPLSKFADWKLPAKFDYSFVEELQLNSNYRGRGHGSVILKRFFTSFTRPTLVALEPGELTRTVKFPSLVRFYRDQGMYLTRLNGNLFAFKWCL